MRTPTSLKSEISYCRSLLDAVRNAVTSVHDGTPDQPEFAHVARAACAPAIIGAAAGVLCGYLARKGKGKPGTGALVGGCVGGVLGFGAGVTWSSRNTTGAIARQAARNVASARDAHWLEKNPIAYA